MQRCKVVGGENENAAERNGGEHRLHAGRADARDLQRLRIEDRRDDQLALAFFGVGQEIASFVDVPDEVRLVPDGIPAFDQRHAAHAPGFLPLRVREPFERAGIPRIARRVRASWRETEIDHHDGRRRPRTGTAPMVDDRFNMSMPSSGGYV